MTRKYRLKIQPQKDNAAFTIIAKSEIHYAKVLAESFIKENPGWDFIIYLCDIFNDLDDLIEPVEAFAKGYEYAPIYSIREYLNFEELEEMLLRLKIEEFSIVLKPFVFEYLLAKKYKKIMYLDPSLLIFTSFNELENDLDNYTIVLPGHSISDRTVIINKTTNNDLLKSDVLSSCLLAINDSNEAGKFINWLKRPLLEFNLSSSEAEVSVNHDLIKIFAEQKIQVKLLSHKKYNAAYWSRNSGKISCGESGWNIDDEHIVFFQFGRSNITTDTNTAHQSRVSEKSNEIDALSNYYYRLIKEKSPDTYSGKIDIYSQVIEHECQSTNRKVTIPEFVDAQYKHVIKNKLLSLNTVGYFSNILGISEIARSFIKNLCRSGIHFSLLDVASSQHSKLPDEDILFFSKFKRSEPSSDITLSFIGADTIESVSRSYSEFYNNKYNIGMWWWEIQNYFPFSNSFNYVNKILVCSEFVKSSIKPFTKLDISKITYPFYPNWNMISPPAAVREQLRIGKNEFVFIFNFDFHSSLTRKNPDEVIHAFSEAFSPDDNVRLIFKSVHGDMHEKTAGLFKDIIAGSLIRDKILWIDKGMGREEWISLLNASDCYITLHRSEGLGLGIIEAMYLGKAVITTGYGGCMDICNADNSLLVDYKIIAVEDETGVYRGGKWADPRRKEAVRHMRNIATSRELYQDLSIKAGQDVRMQYNPRKTLFELYALLYELNGIKISDYFEMI